VVHATQEEEVPDKLEKIESKLLFFLFNIKSKSIIWLKSCIVM